MTATDFLDRLAAEPRLRPIDIAANCLIIEDIPTKLATSLPMESVTALEWDTIVAILTGKREPQALTQMSRCVGYFSRISNWNPSKIGELKDRQKGNYAV